MSALGLGQGQKALVGITTRRTGFGELALVVTLQRFEEVAAHAPLHDGRLQLLIGGCIDGLERQTREGGVGVEAGQQSSGDVALTLLHGLMQGIGKGVDLVLTELNRG